MTGSLSYQREKDFYRHPVHRVRGLPLHARQADSPEACRNHPTEYPFIQHRFISISQRPPPLFCGSQASTLKGNLQL